jgi:membrane fusion protein (multidrug efflux system)
MNRGKFLLAAALSGVLHAQTVQLAKVESKILSRTVLLTGEIMPFQKVDLHARVSGFVEKVHVDRGSAVKEGDPLVSLSAPEMEAQAAEAEAKVKVAESAASEVRARLVSAESTYQRLREASATEGAVSGNEVVIARQTVEALREAVRAAEGAVSAAQASLAALRNMQKYLHIAAPFAGIITERMAHPGALAGPATGPLLRLEQVSRLRLVVAVPEANFSGIRPGTAVTFDVPAHPSRKFSGTVARLARSLDPKTRTMSVELDVANEFGLLAPGMYAQVNWPVVSGERALLVPATSVVRTTERQFVIRSNNGRAEWIDVRRGASDGAHIQVYGPLSAGDLVVRNATDEIRPGTPLPGAAAR